MPPFKQSPGAVASLLTTGLDALANGSAALGATVAQGTALNLMGLFELIIPAYAGAATPAAGMPLYLYLIRAIDNTNFEDGAGGATPVLPPIPDYTFTTLARPSLRQIMQYAIPLPACDFKPLLYNGSGLALGASGNILRQLPVDEQV